MSRTFRLLDLFSGAGGAAVGYHRAGFDELVGVDIVKQPRYPFEFVQGDALEYVAEHGYEFDAIHASPPCQRFSAGTWCRKEQNHHPDLVTPCLKLLRDVGRPFIVENVIRAPLSRFGIVLCGLMFGLNVFRHRRFECSHILLAPEHPLHAGKRIGEKGMVCIAGHGGQSSGYGNRARHVPADHRTKAAWSRGIGIDWMTCDELAQAIPPAYTTYIGKQILRVLQES